MGTKKGKFKLNERKAKFCLEDNGEGNIKVEVEGTPAGLIYLLCQAMERTEHIAKIVTVANEIHEEDLIKECEDDD